MRLGCLGFQLLGCLSGKIFSGAFGKISPSIAMGAIAFGRIPTNFSSRLSKFLSRKTCNGCKPFRCPLLNILIDTVQYLFCAKRQATIFVMLWARFIKCRRRDPLFTIFSENLYLRDTAQHDVVIVDLLMVVGFDPPRRILRRLFHRHTPHQGPSSLNRGANSATLHKSSMTISLTSSTHP